MKREFEPNLVYRGISLDKIRDFIITYVREECDDLILSENSNFCNFPVNVKVKMLCNQYLQGNVIDYIPFLENDCSNKMEGGFDWCDSVEGEKYWNDFIEEGQYEKHQTYLDFRKVIDNIFEDFEISEDISEECNTLSVPAYTQDYDLEMNLTPLCPEEGVKHSTNKLEMSKLFVQFPDALKAVILASTFGHIKYEEFDKDWLNYERVEGMSYEDALIRHQLLKNETEEESKLHPKFHIAWNALADLQKHIKNNNIDVDELAKERIASWKDEFKN